MGRKSKLTERRKEILDHFYMVILEEGFENASIAKIAKRMDVNPSLLIHYFSTKEEMVRGLIDSILDQYQQHFLPALESTPDPEARLNYLLESMGGHKYREKTDGAVYYSCYALVFRDAAIKQRFQDVYRQICDMIVQEIERANAKGVLEVSDPRMAANALIWVAEGMSFYGNIFDHEQPFVGAAGLLRSLLYEPA